MFGESHPLSSPRLWKFVVIFVGVVGFLFLFQKEWISIGNLALVYILFFTKVTDSLPPIPEQAIGIIAANLVVLIIGYIFIVLWAAQFALPVAGLQERGHAFLHLFRQSLPFQMHGPAVFIKNGKLIGSDTELRKHESGVAIVDLSSALVLEQQLGEIETILPDIRFVGDGGNSKGISSLKPGLLKRILRLFGLSKSKKIILVRAKGPGVVFTKSGEKIIGWASLRKQSRVQKKVQALTRDGIEVETNVSVQFTLGEPLETIYVLQKENDWVVVQLESINSRRVIKGFEKDFLSPVEKERITGYFEGSKFKWEINHRQDVNSFSDHFSPFQFDAQRIFDAVYSRARQAKEGKLCEWTDLPLDVATEAFRSQLIRETFDQLYRPNGGIESSVSSFKRSFGIDVRKGAMLFQIVKRKDKRPLAVGDLWSENVLAFSPAQMLRPSSLLQGKGIRIIGASFSELGTDDFVRQQFLENWKASLQKDTEKIMADYELQTLRIYTRERSKRVSENLKK